MRTRSTAGFTLLELLLVCLIVATLAAIVAPSLSGSNERAKLDSTARAVVALARGARARASAEGRIYFLVVDGERREVRLARARDPLAAADVEGDSEVEGDGWIAGAPWARAVPFEDGVSLVWGQVAGTSYAGTGGMPPAVASQVQNTTTSSVFGALPDPSTTPGVAPPQPTSSNNAPIVAPVLAYPRIAFDADGGADDAFIDLEGSGTRVRIVVEAASGRTRILSPDEYDAALSGGPPPLATGASQ